MKIYKIKRLSDGEIMFNQKHDSIDKVEIPKGWGLHLEHQEQQYDEEGPMKDEQGNPIMITVPATCEIIEEEIPEEAVEEKRKKDYQKEIDPFFQEAMLDHIAGDSTKINTLLVKYENIKQKHPKK